MRAPARLTSPLPVAARLRPSCASPRGRSAEPAAQPCACLRSCAAAGTGWERTWLKSGSSARSFCCFSFFNLNEPLRLWSRAAPSFYPGPALLQVGHASAGRLAQNARTSGLCKGACDQGRDRLNHFLLKDSGRPPGDLPPGDLGSAGYPKCNVSALRIPHRPVSHAQHVAPIPGHGAPTPARAARRSGCCPAKDGRDLGTWS